MLFLRNDWSDYVTIEGRTAELESFLKKHLDDEECKILEILAGVFPGNEVEGYYTLMGKHEILLSLVADIHKLLSSTAGSFPAFREFEKSLWQHAKDEEKYLSLLSTEFNQKRTNKQMDLRGNLLTLPNTWV